MFVHHAYLIYGSTPQKRQEFVDNQVKNETRGVNLNNPDVFEIAEEKSIGIDKIRELKNFVSFKPYKSALKIVIIHEADKLTVEAQNALLKTLEEPTTSIIILETKNTSKLLPTITSRCLKIFLGNESKKFNQTQIIQLLNLSSAQRLQKSGQFLVNLEDLTYDLLQFWRRVLLFKINADNGLPISKKTAEKLSIDQVINAITIINNTNQYLNYNINKLLALDVLLLSLPTLNQSGDTKTLD